MNKAPILPRAAVRAIESAIGRDLTTKERRALRNRDAIASAIKDVPGDIQIAKNGQVLIRGGTTTGTPGQLVRFWNKWRENYNALVGLTIARVRALNEQTQRGDHAYPQWTYRTIERRHPVLKALIDSCEEPIENFKWDVRCKPSLPAGFTEDQAKKQQDALKSAYAQIDNLQQAIAHLSHADFRGYAHLQKWRVRGLFDESGNLKDDNARYAYLADRGEDEVFHLECLHTFCLCRDGLFGDWFWNADSRSLTQPETVLGETNRIGGEQLPRADFIIREVERPIDEIALENYVRRKLIEKDWSAFDEIFGIPSGVIIMPPNIPPGQEAAYEAAAKNVAEGGNGAIPNGSDYKPNDAPRDGSNLFKNHMEQLDSDLVLAGTGGKLTMLVSHSQSGGGDARGSSGVQQDVFWQIMFGRASKCAQVLHQDFDIPFLAEAFPGQPPLVEFCLITEDEVDVTALVANVAALKGAGKNVSTDWLADQTGYEFEEDDAGSAAVVEDPAAAGNDDAAADPADTAALRNKDGFVTIEGHVVFVGPDKDETDGGGKSLEWKVNPASKKELLVHASAGAMASRNYSIQQKGSEFHLSHSSHEDFYKDGGKHSQQKIEQLGKFKSLKDAVASANKHNSPLVKAEASSIAKDRRELAAAFHNRADDSALRDPHSALAETLHETLLPLLKRLDAIGKIDDAGMQQHMIEKLLRDFPQIAAALHADDSLAKKLSPLLTENLLKGLQGDALQNRDRILNGDVPGHEFHGNQWTAAGVSAGHVKLRGSKVLEERDRAVRVRLQTDEGSTEEWLPKSHSSVDTEGNVHASKWIIDQKESEMAERGRYDTEHAEPRILTGDAPPPETPEQKAAREKVNAEIQQKADERRARLDKINSAARARRAADKAEKIRIGKEQEAAGGPPAKTGNSYIDEMRLKAWQAKQPK